MENRAVMRRTQNRLAPGRQVRVEWREDRPVLVQPGGTVQLNDSAAAILELCDGTRTSDEVIAEFLAHGWPPGTGRGRAGVSRRRASVRGWIIES